MALLTTGEFYSVTWLPANDPIWVGLPTYPSFPPQLASAVFNATSVICYIIDSASGNFAYVGGQGFGFDDAMVDGTVGPLTKLETTAEDGTTTINVKDPSGGWHIYDVNAGLMRSYSTSEQADLKSFL